MDSVGLTQGSAIQQGIVNAVTYNNGKLGCYVLKSIFDSSGGKWYDIDDLEPIEITEEILRDRFSVLIRNGWRMYELYSSGECSYHVKFWDGDKFRTGLESIDLEIVDSEGMPAYWVDDWDQGEIKYIHQLQNLYLSLSGRELMYWV